MTHTDGFASAIPPKWTRKKLKYLASLQCGNAITAESISESGEYPVYGGNGLRGFTSGFTHSGDFALIGRQGALCGSINYASGRFWASEHAVVVDAGGKLDARWLGELLRSLDLNQYSQSAAQPGLAVATISNLSVPVPPEAEQHAIGAFVARQSAKIDVLVEKKQRLITLLEEKRAALINRAVTKGLDPSAPMKDSGIPWLGLVPAHWQVIRLKHLAIAEGCGIQMGPFGSMLTALSSNPTPYRLYGQENTISGDFAIGDRWITKEQYLSLRKYALVPGDIVLTRKGSIGKARLLPDTIAVGIMDSDTIRIRVDHDRSAALFLVRLLHEAWYLQVQIEANSRGAILAGLNSATIGDLQIVLPPLPEQIVIRDYLDRVTERVDAVIFKTREQIAKFEEYRTALISAAVTGKIDVRGSAQV